MFLLIFFALVIGFCLFYIPGNGLAFSETLTRYSAVAIVAGLDTLIGGLRAWLTNAFDSAIFTSGFVVNIVLATGLVGLGEYMGLETGFGDSRISVMMIAAVVVFSARILGNLSMLRRLLIERLRERQQVKDGIVTRSASQSLE